MALRVLLADAFPAVGGGPRLPGAGRIAVAGRPPTARTLWRCAGGTTRRGHSRFHLPRLPGWTSPARSSRRPGYGLIFLTLYIEEPR